MRVVAGTLKAQVFDAPRGHRTHPMSDKIRGALFNALGELDGLTVFDPFAGSGALSFEAISRGAKYVVALDIDPQAAAVMKKNAAKLNTGSRIKITRAGVRSWLQTQPTKRFDVVLLDPPYDDLQEPALQAAAERCEVQGVVVLSLPPQSRVALPSDRFELIRDKQYGDAELHYYRRVR